MAVASPYPLIDIPEVDTWTFLFESKKDFADDKGEYTFLLAQAIDTDGDQ